MAQLTQNKVLVKPAYQPNLNQLNIIISAYHILSRRFNVSAEVLQLVCRFLIESVLSFNPVSLYASLSAKNKAMLAQVVNQTGKTACIKQLQLCDLYQQTLRGKAVHVYHDPTHPINSFVETLPSHAKTVTRDFCSVSYKHIAF